MLDEAEGGVPVGGPVRDRDEVQRLLLHRGVATLGDGGYR
jgi:hypothetical protein